VHRSLIISFGFHTAMIMLTVLSLPFLAKKPVDLPPLISVDLIQISDITNIPFAPKAKKIIEKIKKEKEKLVSEQAPPKKVKKENPKSVSSLDNKVKKIQAEDPKAVSSLDNKVKKIQAENPKAVPSPDQKLNKIDEKKAEAIPLPKKKMEKVKMTEEKKQNPEKEDIKKVEMTEEKKLVKEDTKVKQVSEFEKEELFDPYEIAAKIDKAKEEKAETTKKTNKFTQSQDENMNISGLTFSEEDALKAQIFGCWSIPLGLPYNESLLVKIKLKLKPDGTITKTEILDHARMNKPGQAFYKVLAESALRALRNSKCIPLEVPTTGYERWKDLQLNFDAREMLGGG